MPKTNKKTADGVIENRRAMRENLNRRDRRLTARLTALLIQPTDRPSEQIKANRDDSTALTDEQRKYLLKPSETFGETVSV